MLSVGVLWDSQWVVSGSNDQCVQFWDLHTGQAQLLHGHKNSGECGGCVCKGVGLTLTHAEQWS